MNNVVLIGRITKKPELNYTQQNHTPICKFTLAVDRVGEGADFINIVTYNKQAENVCKYLDKGRQVGVQGRIQTGSYDNKEGKKVYTFDIIANIVKFIDKAERNEETSESQEGYSEVDGYVPFD